jgi:hypothetical protein
MERTALVISPKGQVEAAALSNDLRGLLNVGA